MKVVNLTPHPINIVDGKGIIFKTYEPSGLIARVSSYSEPIGYVDGRVPVFRQKFGPVYLPDPEPNTIYLVSSLVGQALAQSGRDDVYGPDTSPQSVVKDSVGRIIGTRGLVKYGQ